LEELDVELYGVVHIKIDVKEVERETLDWIDLAQEREK
jgi:hypothetical protein